MGGGGGGGMWECDGCGFSSLDHKAQLSSTAKNWTVSGRGK